MGKAPNLPIMVAQGFPFIGAGIAAGFGWTDVHVCFSRTPNAEETRLIARKVPKPLRYTRNWKGPLLYAASTFDGGFSVAMTYDDKARKKAATQQFPYSRFRSAHASAYVAFNAAVDAWLLSAHAIVPIVVVVRRADGKTGIAHSEWHRESLKALGAVLEHVLRLAKKEPAVGKFGLLLLEWAKVAKVRVSAAFEKRMITASKTKHDLEAEASAAEQGMLYLDAEKALGKPAPPYTKRRSFEQTRDAIQKLAWVMPWTARHLWTMAQEEGLTLRPGASPAAIERVEKTLGLRLCKDHRAFLGAFDGGQIGKLVILGTAEGGAVRDAELVAFTRIWNGFASGARFEQRKYVLFAQSDRERVLALERNSAGPAYTMVGSPGWGGSPSRTTNSFDLALARALDEKQVWKQPNPYFDD
ncbi:hypothetical protein BH09MYX1_BH09MYX1_06240 [soil metagenome]